MAKAESDLPIYVSWIGTTDINCMESWRVTEGLDTLPENSSRLTIPFKEEPGQNGPIRTFTDNNKFYSQRHHDQSHNSGNHTDTDAT